VRRHYDYRKIVHKGEWLDRVRDLLRDPRHYRRYQRWGQRARFRRDLL